MPMLVIRINRNVDDYFSDYLLTWLTSIYVVVSSSSSYSKKKRKRTTTLSGFQNNLVRINVLLLIRKCSKNKK